MKMNGKHDEESLFTFSLPPLSPYTERYVNGVYEPFICLYGGKFFVYSHFVPNESESDLVKGYRFV